MAYITIPANTALSDTTTVFGESVRCADTTHTALIFGDTYGFQIAVPTNTETVLDIYLSTDGTENTFSIREDSSTGDIVESGTVSTYVDDDYTASEHFTFKLKNDTESNKSFYLLTESGTLRLMYLSTAEYEIIGGDDSYTASAGTVDNKTLISTSQTLPVIIATTTVDGGSITDNTSSQTLINYSIPANTTARVNALLTIVFGGTDETFTVTITYTDGTGWAEYQSVSGTSGDKVNVNVTFDVSAESAVSCAIGVNATSVPFDISWTNCYFTSGEAGAPCATFTAPAFSDVVLTGRFSGGATFLLNDQTHRPTEPFADLLIDEVITDTDEHTWTFENNTAEEVTYGYGADGELSCDSLTASITPKQIQISTRYYIDEGTVLTTSVTTFGTMYRADSDHSAITFSETSGFALSVPASTVAQISLWLSTNGEGESGNVIITENTSTGTVLDSATVDVYVNDDYTGSQNVIFSVTNDDTEPKDYFIRAESGLLRLMYLADVSFIALGDDQRYTSTEIGTDDMPIIETTETLPVGCEKTFSIPPYSTVTIKGRFSRPGDYIITTDGTGYTIDSAYDFEADNHATSSSGAGDYTFMSNGSSVTVARADVKEVCIKIPLDRASSTYFCGYLFYNCTNLTTAEVTFSGECTSVGNYFCAYMFDGCSSLVSLPDEFNIPQGITSVGSNFCAGVFEDCNSLASLPDKFNLPQGITSVGIYFCLSMFNGCSKLSEGEPVVLTFPFDATNAFLNTNITPTSPSAGTTYYLLGNSKA